jgi:hypothetical protein
MLAEAVDRARQIGEGLLGTVTDLIGDLADRGRDAFASTKGMARPSCQCSRVCWMPDERPPIVSRVSPCGTATVCFTVRNCGLEPREVFVATTGEHADLAVGAPASAVIGALDSATLVAKVALPEDTTEARLILWVRGCKDTAVRWTVKTSSSPLQVSSHHVFVEDCPDTQHHWHDHFAQARDCRNRPRG